MSVISSMFTGASGITAHGDALQVVGDNIANSNTVGYKGSRANFEDVLARSMGGAELGLGTRLAGVQKILSQGALLGTGVSTDLAIKGDGFFQVKGKADGLDGAFYTRAGQFKVDKDGNLVNQSGLKLQGYNSDENGNLIQQVADLQVPSYELPPVATTASTIVANLNSDEVAPANPWDPTNPSATSNFSTSMTVYDSLGKAHNVDVYFRREAAAGAWSWHGLVDGGEVTGGTAGVPTQAATGTLTFDTQGRLTTEATTTSDFDFLGAVQNQAIAFDFGDSITTDGGSGLKGVTSYASPSGVTFLSQDGSSSGSLAGISITPNGEIQGVFSNGMQRTVGRVLVADFQNPQDLARTGGNLFIATNESGGPLVGEAGTGGRGAIVSGSLEQSNVDLANEFVNMIAYQRGYQASSRIITVADQVLQETVNLKR